MGYAIVGYFDQASDEKIKALWKALADIGVDNYLINSENSPHIKFAMFNSIDLPSVQNELQLLSKRLEKINIHFKKYGLYPGDKPFVTIDIADNNDILKLHMEIQNTINQLGEKDNRDVNFVLSNDMVSWQSGFQIPYLADTSMPFNVKLEKIGVIEFTPAKQLFSYPLS